MMYRGTGHRIARVLLEAEIARQRADRNRERQLDQQPIRRGEDGQWVPCACAVDMERKET